MRKFFNVETVGTVTFYMDDTTSKAIAVVGDFGPDTEYFATFTETAIDKTSSETISPIPTREDAERVALAILWAFGWTRVNPGESAMFTDNA